MEYIIITRKHYGLLEESVNEKIKEGYRPIGGIAIVSNASGYGTCYCQAMIKENK